MSSPKSKQPMNWDDYEAGRTSPRGSIGSNSSRPRFSRLSPTATSDYRNFARQDEENTGRAEVGPVVEDGKNLSHYVGFGRR